METGIIGDSDNEAGERKAIKYLSLFSGIGGFELGIGQSGIPAECVGYSEINKYAIAVYSRHYPGHRNYGDITRIDPDTIPDIDMFCGGFPCQSFSIAGKRRGFDDTRGTMFFEVARILRVKRPRIVWLENVKGLLNHDKGQTFSVIISTLEELGYDVQWMVLNSKFFGVPQNRERVFIIGSLRGERRPEVLPFRQADEEHSSAVTAEEGIYDCASTMKANDYPAWNGNYIRRKDESNHFPCSSSESEIDLQGHTGDKRNDYSHGVNVILQHSRDSEGNVTAYNERDIAGSLKQPSGNQQNFVMEKTHTKMDHLGVLRKGEFGDGIKDECSFTMDSSCGRDLTIVHNLQPRQGQGKGGKGHLQKEGDSTYCLDAHNNQAVQLGYSIRRLTPVECERLQGFPDGWTEGISDTQRYKCLGNAVTVNVIRAIAERLLA